MDSSGKRRLNEFCVPLLGSSDREGAHISNEGAHPGLPGAVIGLPSPRHEPLGNTEGTSVPLNAACNSSAGLPESDGLRRPRRRLAEFSTLVPEQLRDRLSRLIPLPDAPQYGKKTIGQFGSFVYLVNQIFGAGILALPLVVKMSGWLPSLLANLLVCVVAMFGTLMILRSMTMIAGNQNFDRRMEYIPTVEYFLGKRMRFWTETCFYLSIQSLNVVSIAVVSQSIDHLILRAFGVTAAAVADPFQGVFCFRSFDTQQSIDDLYLGKRLLATRLASAGGSGVVFAISLGYVINAMICIPLSSQTMDENMKIQYVSFTFLVASVAQISLSAAAKILAARSSLSQGSASKYASREAVRPPRAFGCYQYAQLLSTFIASYSYVNVIPSWGNEMTGGVRVNEAVYLGSLFAAVTYYVFGFLLAYAYPAVHTDNVLQELLADDCVGIVTRFFIYVFNLLTVLPGILVYSITTRYNLLNSGVASPRGSFMWGCVLPFGFAWLLANDLYFSAVLQWSSLLFSLAVNFVIPAIVYIAACSTQRLASRNPTRHSKSLLSFTSRTRDGVQTLMGDISSRLRDYLETLPPTELDPDLRALLHSQSSLKSHHPLATVSSNVVASEGNSRPEHPAVSKLQPLPSCSTVEFEESSSTSRSLKESLSPVTPKGNNRECFTPVEGIAPTTETDGGFLLRTLSTISHAIRRSDLRFGPSQGTAGSARGGPGVEPLASSTLGLNRYASQPAPSVVSSFMLTRGNRPDRRRRTVSQQQQLAQTFLHDDRVPYKLSDVFSAPAASFLLSEATTPATSPRQRVASLVSRARTVTLPVQKLLSTTSYSPQRRSSIDVDSERNAVRPVTVNRSDSAKWRGLATTVSVRSPSLNREYPSVEISNVFPENVLVVSPLPEPHPFALRAQRSLEMLLKVQALQSAVLRKTSSTKKRSVSTSFYETGPPTTMTLVSGKNGAPSITITPTNNASRIGIEALDAVGNPLLRMASVDVQPSVLDGASSDGRSSTSQPSFSPLRVSVDRTMSPEMTAHLLPEIESLSTSCRNDDHNHTLHARKLSNDSDDRDVESFSGSRNRARDPLKHSDNQINAAVVPASEVSEESFFNAFSASCPPGGASSVNCSQCVGPSITRPKREEGPYDEFLPSPTAVQPFPETSSFSPIQSMSSHFSETIWGSGSLYRSPRERLNARRCVTHIPRSPRSLMLAATGSPPHDFSSFHPPGSSYPHFTSNVLLPPPVSLKELPVEPPVDLMSEAITGAEDAYECDEEATTGDLKPIRIHVFPKGYLRTHHLLATKFLMCILVAFCLLSAGSQLIVDLLQSWGELSLPSGDCV